MGFPSHLTFLLVLSASDDIATFGYGIGTGPAGVGVLHTSGNAMETPPLAWCTTDRLLTPTVTGMLAPPGERRGSRGRRRGQHSPRAALPFKRRSANGAQT